MFTVTGITVAQGVPEEVTKGGTAYFFYVTATSLSSRAAPAPTTVGFAGSADGRGAALTLASTGLPGCPVTTAPDRMRRGDSYSTCLVSVADPGQRLGQVIYWADTTSNSALDYKSDPVVWSLPTPPSASVTPSAG